MQLSRANWRAETIVLLETRCKQLQTDPGLAKVLVQGISQWLHGTDQMNYLTFQPKYRGVITQQNDIGWRQLFNGRMSNEWARFNFNLIMMLMSKRCGNRKTPAGPCNLQLHTNKQHKSELVHNGPARSLLLYGSNGIMSGRCATQ
jgi:hypothetical protein